MMTKNTVKAKKSDLLKGVKTIKKTKKVQPDEINFSDIKMLAELLDLEPKLFDSGIKNPIFKKTDFLSSKRISKALYIDETLVLNEMMFLYRYNVTFSRGKMKSQMVIKAKNSHHFNNFRLHPLALPTFIEKLMAAEKLQQVKTSINKTTQGKQHEI